MLRKRSSNYESSRRVARAQDRQIWPGENDSLNTSIAMAPATLLVGGFLPPDTVLWSRH
ncbi:hypothetical protein FA95DRAFT_1563455 [Auriscalpium vulgare]|uniref:Uncharacterized protein n=1 Tax=Auriscalpium vulgare TaxID=40419 RepID=A0ACB8RIH4_9AGAM|nr:hypothetical protein FA95DRAFT_1563455 [Auriscalpium vulgare]